jgi:histidinol-phosphate phosphatase family protein
VTPTAVFLDRDGVIIRELPHYVLRSEQLEILPGATDAIARLHRAGYVVVVVTNQSPVGRGLLSVEELDAIHSDLGDRVRQAGGEIAGFFVCPHLPDAGCDCRKPRPGLLLQASARLGVDVRASFMVGDQRVDMEAAKAAGCRAILVLSGQTAAVPAAAEGIWQVAADLADAADLILATDAAKPRPRGSSAPLDAGILERGEAGFRGR